MKDINTAANFLKEKGIKDTLYGSVGGDVWVKGGLSALIDEFAVKNRGEWFKEMTSRCNNYYEEVASLKHENEELKSCNDNACEEIKRLKKEYTESEEKWHIGFRRKIKETEDLKEEILRITDIAIIQYAASMPNDLLMSENEFVKAVKEFKIKNNLTFPE